MTICERGKTKMLERIQLEDWSNDLPTIHRERDVLAAYPVAGKTNRVQLAGGIIEYPKQGQRFRLEMHFPSPTEAEKAFRELLAGKKTLKEYSGMFRETSLATKMQLLQCLQ